MSGLECAICCHLFNSCQNLPRILHCGHTICTQCLDNVLQTSKACPSCREVTLSDNVDDYVVNYIVVKICESNEIIHAKENFIQLYQEKLEMRQEEHQFLRTTLESLKDNIDLNLYLVKSNEEQLTSLLDDCNPFNPQSGRKIKEIDERFDTIPSQVSLQDSNLISNVNLKSKDFTSTDEYLKKLHKMIVVENKKVVALLKVNGVPQGANLSFRGDILFITAFEGSQGMDDNATTVCFQDLQNILLRSGLAESIFGFLDLFYHKDSLPKTVMITTNQSTSSLGSQFLKLCTGEFGISYKGREYEQLYGGTTTIANGPVVGTDLIIQLKDINWNMKEVDNYSTYFLKKNDNRYKCSVNCCYLTFNSNGSFDIFRYVNSYAEFDWDRVVGVINDEKKEFGSTFKDASYRKIANCGIAVQFKFIK